MNTRGSIGLICILVVTLLVLLCQSLYNLAAADYRYLKNYVRQRQVVYAVSSGLQALERANYSANTNTNIYMTTTETLLPDDTMAITMSTYNKNGIEWLVCQGSAGDIAINMVQGLFALPNSRSDLAAHNLCSTIFNIDPTATIEGSSYNYLTNGDGSFVDFDIATYARYAFVQPGTDEWKIGLGRNVFTDPLGGSLTLPGGRIIRGWAVFASQGDITVAAGGNYPDRLQLIANGNIIVEGNAKLDNVFILAGNSVKISQGSKINGKIFARRGIVVEKNVTIKNLPAEQLVISTDKYLW